MDYSLDNPGQEIKNNSVSQLVNKEKHTEVFYNNLSAIKRNT